MPFTQASLGARLQPVQWVYKNPQYKGLPDSKLLRGIYFCLCLDISRKWGITWFHNFWGTFLPAFGHFSGEKGGGLPDSKDDEEHFLVWLGHFKSLIWEDDQSPNTLRNFSLYKIRFWKKFLEGFQKTGRGGGVKAILKKTKQKQIFFLDGFP